VRFERSLFQGDEKSLALKTQMHYVRLHSFYFVRMEAGDFVEVRKMVLIW